MRTTRTLMLLLVLSTTHSVANAGDWSGWRTIELYRNTSDGHLLVNTDDDWATPMDSQCESSGSVVVPGIHDNFSLLFASVMYAKATGGEANFFINVTCTEVSDVTYHESGSAKFR